MISTLNISSCLADHLSLTGTRMIQLFQRYCLAATDHTFVNVHCWPQSSLYRKRVDESVNSHILFTKIQYIASNVHIVRALLYFIRAFLLHGLHSYLPGVIAATCWLRWHLQKWMWYSIHLVTSGLLPHHLGSPMISLPHCHETPQSNIFNTNWSAIQTVILRLIYVYERCLYLYQIAL